MGGKDMLINTDRLLIRDFQLEDWESVLKYTSDSNVMEYIPEGVLSEKGVKDLIRENVGENAEKFPVIFKEENALIGHMVFHKWGGERTYEIGWVFNPQYHNKGLASEAAMAILKYSFEELKIHRIIATCQPQNIASYRVMEKVGMRREGHFKKCIPANYKKGSRDWWDEYFYAILAEEWEDKTKL
ncbi:ribosomal-protein-S5-alanine N-acetyltransferase [Oceanobacillus picturae]|uniref:Ribosomal-protein-S5-alanine N-acetyltransferase n=2 Tax=Oceanobacillus picturae TaxID=171693 RepID=A0A0U9HAM7_9BACI|nr:ribosomal-protein-S5-alanine N-acetyltransferase [Oceanobacillus picturae]